MTRGITYSVTETITNTKLHQLVDNGSVSSIVDADCDAAMALANSKLANIVDAGKVSGSSFIFLSTIPSGAGLIPYANLPFITSTMISFTSIPNSALVPLTLASLVDGMSLRNLASTPVDQQIRYNLLVSSIASGGFPQYNGSNNFIGKNQALTLLSNNSISGLSNSGDISISNTGNYLIRFTLNALSANDSFIIRFNNNTGSNYAYTLVGQTAATTAVNAGSTGTTFIGMTGTVLGDSGSTNVQINGNINIYPQATGNGTLLIDGKTIYQDSSGYAGITVISFSGTVLASLSATITSFRILTSGGATFSGNIYLYQYSVS